jgi:hypothetical protein
MRGVNIMCFFSFKDHEKTYMSLGSFLFGVYFSFQDGVLGFSRSYISLLQFLDCFLGELGQELVEKQVFR